MSNDLKKMRGQMRQIVQELHPEALKSELVQSFAKEFRELQVSAFAKMQDNQNARLKALEDDVREQVGNMNKRSKAVEGFLMRTVTVEMQQKQHNTFITMEAWHEITTERLTRAAGILAALASSPTPEFRGELAAELSSLFAPGDDFNKAIDERKKTIEARLEAEAEERMKAAMEQQQAAVAAEQANQPAPAETPAVEQQPAPEASAEKATA